ncbi:MAG: orotidine-5'-phosphate decarboxylase [Tissierellia bacterium]|nr:orotidine-5'-phosphate decarboxylase [Tissierellia bacterium]
MIIDRLYKRVKEVGNVCVGLDTNLERLPESFKRKFDNKTDIIFNFNKEIIDNTKDLAAIYKPQIAYYEREGIEGLMAYIMTLRYLKDNSLLSIGDIKRGDIQSTADMYAKAHFDGEFEADFITLSPYMGFDSIDPYLKYLEDGKKGIFVLVRTSNPGAKDLEYLEAKSLPIYNYVGDYLAKIGKDYMGECGYSSVGGVVGGTHTDEAKEIRARYKNMFILIPGYGAQGGTAKDCNLYLKDGNGGVVNSSRGIIYNFQKFDDGEENIGHYARMAVLDMKKALEENRG